VKEFGAAGSSKALVAVVLVDSVENIGTSGWREDKVHMVKIFKSLIEVKC
jgi:hypothetical protein